MSVNVSRVIASTLVRSKCANHSVLTVSSLTKAFLATMGGRTLLKSVCSRIEVLLETRSRLDSNFWQFRISVFNEMSRYDIIDIEHGYSLISEIASFFPISDFVHVFSTSVSDLIFQCVSWILHVTSRAYSCNKVSILVLAAPRFVLSFCLDTPQSWLWSSSWTIESGQHVWYTVYTRCFIAEDPLYSGFNFSRCRSWYVQYFFYCNHAVMYKEYLFIEYENENHTF